MKFAIGALAALGLMVGAAHAQSDKPMNSDKTSPGTTGAMKNPTAPNVATDPEQVKAQQGDSSKSSPGTVGAAPGANTDSQKANDSMKK